MYKMGEQAMPKSTPGYEGLMGIKRERFGQGNSENSLVDLNMGFSSPAPIYCTIYSMLANVSPIGMALHAPSPHFHSIPFPYGGKDIK